MPTESVLSSFIQGMHRGTPQQNEGESGARQAASLANFHRGAITAERRRITPTNGRALEILGHAIEYLADEYAMTALQMGTLDSGDPRVEAVQLLILLNREVYFSNPEYEPLHRRLARRLFGPSRISKAEQPARLDPRA